MQGNVKKVILSILDITISEKIITQYGSTGMKLVTNHSSGK